MRLWVCFCIALGLCRLGRAEDKEKAHSQKTPGKDDLQDGTYRISSPQLTSEEKMSTHMPENLRCDACRAIAFQMQEYLSKAESKRSSMKQGEEMLSESDYIDALDKCCSQSWEKYGMMEADGEKRISGPGIEIKQQMSMMMTGGPWPAKLYQMCQSYLGEFGEDEIYEQYRSNKAHLEDFLCYDPGKVCSKQEEKKRARKKVQPSHNEL
ncbi:marginal zone B- and B1-cell-specific protein [Protopterus annectens]|uniref:marginal zone B- and B1-cell-specific protein n=1 Tax=Protopterus annectens TaxID=7888 RepID=UPI001CFA9275|nr:marginal zone B- and B1-cell-specific protein [Protopterus annectens]